MRDHPRLRRALRLTAKIFGFFVLGWIAIVAIVLLTINVPPVSGWVAGRVNAALAPMFEGKLELRRLGHLDFGGLSDAELEVFDAAGNSVLTARDIDVRLFWPGVAWQALVQRPEVLRVPIDRVALDEVNVTLIDDGNGTPTIASAFQPKPSEPEEPSSGGTAIELDELTIETTIVRGALAGVGPIDMDLGQLRARLESDPRGTHMVLENLAIVARQLPQVGTVSGQLTADVTLPTEPEKEPARDPDASEPVAKPAKEPTKGSDKGKEDAPDRVPVAGRSGPNTSVYALSPAPVQRILANFKGEIAGSGAIADLRMTGEELAATFDADALQPATVTRLVPALAPAAPLALSAQVRGVLSDLAFEARLAQRAAEIRARGKVARVGEESKIEAHVTTSKLDLSSLLPEGAKTALNLGADAALELDAKGGAGSYRVTTSESWYGGEALPVATIDGQLKMPSDAPLTTAGVIEIAEAGAPTTIDYDVTSSDAGVIAKVSSLTKVDKPPRLREASGAQLSGEIASRAHYDASRDVLDAEVRVNMTDLRHPELRAARLDVAALARGKASRPDLELLVNLTGVRAQDRRFSRVRVHALGTSEELKVGAQAYGTKPDKVDFRAIVAPSSEQLVRSPVVRVQDVAGNVVIRAAGVERRDGRLTVDRLTMDGPGHASARVAYGTELEQLKLDADGLDVAKLLRIAGVRSNLGSAKLDIEAEFHNGRQPRGKLVANVSEIGLGRLRGGTASADFVLSSGKISGKADLELTRGAKTTIAVDGVRSPFGAGPPPSLETLGGEIKVKGDINLERLQPFMPFAGVERASGQLEFDIDIQRNPDSKKVPTFRARLKSDRLVLVSERPDVEQMPSADQAKGKSPWTLRGIDVDLDAVLENHSAKLAARLFDTRGDVFTLNTDFREIGDLRNPRRAFERAPFTARVTMPRRRFNQWPAPIQPAEIEGALTLQVDADGTLLAPNVRARGRIDGFRAATDNPRLRRVDLELGAQYRTSGGDLVVKAHEKGKVVLGVDSRWTGDVARAGDALSASGGKSPLQADVKLTLDDFPVDVVPDLQHRHVQGSLSGHAELTGLGSDGRFSLDLSSKRILVDRLILDEVRARVATRDDRLELEAQLAGGGGSVAVRAGTGFVWKDRLMPVVDRDQLEGELTARKFLLATLQPIVEGSVSELEGKLDANIRAKIEGGQPRLSGQARVEDAALQLPSIGQRFSDISATVAITPDSVSIKDVKARGISGGFEAEAEAQLVGLTPMSARAMLKIDEDDKLPLTVEGESMGDAWGRIETSFRVDEANKTRHIDVDLKKFHVELPAAPPQGIQDLNQAEHVRVGYWRQDRDFVTIPLQPLEAPPEPAEYATVVTVDLGELWVEKGQQAEVAVGGKITAKLGAELDVTGKLETKRGKLDISGKTFEIERGAVTFTGGPPDTPIISAVARYDSPAGFTVYAEYTGTATEGKLALRSDPPLSQDEILTLLMFGTPDGSFGAGTGTGNQLSAAVSVVGSTAAQGLNRALSKITDLEVQARIDTSTGAPRPELVLQLTPRVAARVTQALGEPSPGQSPDRTFVTIELRIASAWSLSTMVGDRGASAIDVIWRRRY
jgi:translocation and assembly module TamB